MNYLCIKTSSDNCTLTLWSQKTELVTINWDTYKTLADEIFVKIKEVLRNGDISYQELNGLVVYSGPGSFTGLRISHTVFNSLAYSLGIPITGAKGVDWVRQGIKKLINGQASKIILPEYGGQIKITQPKK